MSLKSVMRTLTISVFVFLGVAGAGAAAVAHATTVQPGTCTVATDPNCQNGSDGGAGNG